MGFPCSIYTFWYLDRRFDEGWIQFETVASLDDVWHCYASVGYRLAKEDYAIAFTQRLKENNWKLELIYYRDCSPDLIAALLKGKG